jgi:phosphatidate cytidylyltransferase
VLLQRVAVAAVGLPLLALLLWSPEPAFAGILELILAVAAFEIVRSAVGGAPLTLPLGAGAATALFVAVQRVYPEIPLWSFLLVTAFALVAILWRRVQLAVHPGGWWLVAVLYTAVPGAHLVQLRNVEDGVAWLILLLAAVFLTDTGAYATGRLFGRRLLAPGISPHKTWEGAVGGFVFGALAAAITALLLDIDVETVGLVAIAVTLPVAAIAGDLLESAMKRRMGVKDMSGLLPGHGGFADRLDSILAAGTCLYWIARWQL